MRSLTRSSVVRVSAAVGGVLLTQTLASAQCTPYPRPCEWWSAYQIRTASMSFRLELGSVGGVNLDNAFQSGLQQINRELSDRYGVYMNGSTSEGNIQVYLSEELLRRPEFVWAERRVKLCEDQSPRGDVCAVDCRQSVDTAGCSRGTPCRRRGRPTLTGVRLRPRSWVRCRSNRSRTTSSRCR